jgi:hypothetical protein
VRRAGKRPNPSINRDPGFGIKDSRNKIKHARGFIMETSTEEQVGITELESLIARLEEPDRALIREIFDVRTSTGSLVCPEIQDIVRGYGKRDQVESQKIVKVTNLVTYEGALFNELRSRRPFQTEEKLEIEKIIADTKNCFFCGPEARKVTPGDTFIPGGRIEKATCFSASNPGKYDGYHGLVIFKDHSPYSFQNFPDYLDCALEWARMARSQSPGTRHFFFMWNCLWKAGGSIIHGHTQMSLTKGLHYAKTEQLLKAFKDYREGRAGRFRGDCRNDPRKGASCSRDYFEDLFQAHRALGLGFQSGSTRIMAYLTPIKEKETLVLASDLYGVKRTVPKILDCFCSRLGVRSFNLGLICSPGAAFSDRAFPEYGEEETVSKKEGLLKNDDCNLNEKRGLDLNGKKILELDEDKSLEKEEDLRWEGFPIIVRIVDRGSLENRTADMGAMELYASSVISSDPFKVARELKAKFS